MSRQYQNSKHLAAQRFEQRAKSNPVPIQLTFPAAWIAELAPPSLGDLLRSAGKSLIDTVMESEVGTPVETSSRPNPDWTHIGGTETGYCVIDGQKTPRDRFLGAQPAE